MSLSRVVDENHEGGGPMKTYRVAEGTQVHLEGRNYLGGETFELADDVQVSPWLKAMLVTEVEPAKPAKKKPVAPAQET